MLWISQLRVYRCFKRCLTARRACFTLLNKPSARRSRSYRTSGLTSPEHRPMNVCRDTSVRHGVRTCRTCAWMLQINGYRPVSWSLSSSLSSRLSLSTILVLFLRHCVWFAVTVMNLTSWAALTTVCNDILSTLLYGRTTTPMQLNVAATNRAQAIINIIIYALWRQRQ